MPRNLYTPRNGTLYVGLKSVPNPIIIGGLELRYLSGRGDLPPPLRSRLLVNLFSKFSWLFDRVAIRNPCAKIWGHDVINDVTMPDYVTYTVIL